MDKIGDLLHEKVLVVDDTRFHRAMLADMLTHGGYCSVEVEGGARALDMVMTESPDLIILDSRMRDLDGIEVCRKIKQDPFTHHIPILILTAATSGPDRINALRAGADGYLSKPFGPAELIAQVEALLRRSFHCDPITGLPAAPYVHRQIDARLAQNLPTAVLYADLDRFRSYNLAYGHEGGDKVLQMTARFIVESLPARGAFVGHLGSDDFIAVLPPEGADTFAQTLVERFEEHMPSFYSETDFHRGAVLVETGQGRIEQRLMTLSAALVSNQDRPLINYLQVSELLSEVMANVKAQGGGRWARDRRLR